MKRKIFALSALALVFVLLLVPSLAFAEEIADPVLPVVEDFDYFVPLATNLYIGPAVGSSPSRNDWGQFTIDSVNTNFVHRFNSRFYVYDLPKVDLGKMPDSDLGRRARLWFDFSDSYSSSGFGCVVYARELLGVEYVCTLAIRYLDSTGAEKTKTDVAFNTYVYEYASFVSLVDLDISSIVNVRLTLTTLTGLDLSRSDVYDLSNLSVMFFAGDDVSVQQMSSYAIGLIMDYNSYLNDDYNAGLQNGYNAGHYDGYNSGYSAGNADGYDSGYDVGFTSGKTQGYTEGYNKGTESASSYSFFSLISAVVDVPINAILSLFNFELFGFNLQPLLTTILTLCVALAIIRLIL